MAKSVARKPVSREKFEKALDAYVETNNKFTRQAAERDARVKAIDDEYDFEEMKESMETHYKTVQQYCEDNRGTLFVDKKSLVVGPVKYGFREGKEKVVLLDGFKLKDVVAKMNQSNVWSGFIRVEPALDKNKLIAEKPRGMQRMGVDVVQEENFFLDVEETNDGKAN